jgi:hypothetical protein
VKTITLRNLPPEIQDHVEAKSRELGLSLNKTVLRLLEASLSPSEKILGVARHRDLDHLAGSWSAGEADEFDRTLDEQRRIDPTLWD